ncbi:MAG: aldo/keto reductase [Phycisphaerae bacterium]|jgi:aryl-alcohol dehydrogenase-like predicted oxidoreductase
MRTRKLGNSELELTTVGFGAWAIGGPWEFGWGPQDDNDSIAAIRAGLDMGINWIDTAPAYGHGHSEEIVGKVLKDISHKPIIATKCGIIWDKTRDKITWLREKSIINECHQSLKRLGVDVIDLYHMHWGEPDEQIEEGIGAMAKLQEQGKIRYIGVSNFTVGQIKRARKVADVVSLQPPYSMLRRETEDELLPYCAENNIGVVVYSPMHKGLLTGKFSEQKINELAEDDHRRRDPEFKGEKFKATLELVDELRPIAQRNGITLAQLAIAWVLRREEVTSAIVGARKPSQTKETAPASEIDLPREDIEQIEELLERRQRKINR